jgi:hypothetical protein
MPKPSKGGRSCQPRPLSVELLETRCLLSGSNLTVPLALVAPPTEAISPAAFAPLGRPAVFVPYSAVAGDSNGGQNTLNKDPGWNGGPVNDGTAKSDSPIKGDDDLPAVSPGAGTPNWKTGDKGVKDGGLPPVLAVPDPIIQILPPLDTKPGVADGKSQGDDSGPTGVPAIMPLVGGNTGGAVTPWEGTTGKIKDKIDKLLPGLNSGDGAPATDVAALAQEAQLAEQIQGQGGMERDESLAAASMFSQATNQLSGPGGADGRDPFASVTMASAASSLSVTNEKSREPQQAEEAIAMYWRWLMHGKDASADSAAQGVEQGLRPETMHAPPVIDSLGMLANARSEGLKGCSSDLAQGSVNGAEPGRLAGREVVDLAPESADGADLAQGLVPLGAGLLSNAAAVDMAAVEQGVQHFFGRLDELGNQLAEATATTRTPSWLVALAAAGTALEITRRQMKYSGGIPGQSGAGAKSTWTWFPGMPDPLPREER